MSRKGGMPTRGIPPFLELLMGFGSRLRARSSAALTVYQTVIHYRSPSSPEKNKRFDAITDHVKPFILNGADYGARTRYLNLGKVALYQMS